MKKGSPILLYVMLFLVFISVFRLFSEPRTEEIPYSTFKALVTEHKVKDVVISQDAIKGVRSADKAGEKDKPFTVVRVDDPDLVKSLAAAGISYRGDLSGNWLRDFLLTWILPLVVLMLIWSFVFRRMASGGPGETFMSFGKSRAKIYSESDVKVTFNDVAGVDEAKEELMEIIEFLRRPDKFTKLGGRIPKGVLLVGPPGTGKTLLSRAVAGEAKVPFFSLSGSEFVEMFVGVGASRVRDLFQQAVQKAPCIIFIDELDALGRARGIGIAGTHEEREQTLNQLLAEMDGFDARKGVIIMAATNRPEILDPALLRPGRFDRQVLVDRPNIKDREEILKVHIRGVKLSKDVDIAVVAARTPGFVGADLANIVNEAALLAARKSKTEVDMTDFEAAIDRVMTGLEKKTRVMNKKEKETVAYHECGHTLVAELLPTTDPVHRVSIVQRGIAALGYTLQLPTEDRYLMTKTELQDKLCVMLGGRVAEEIIFHEVSTGAQNDLQRAALIARTMVTEYGMTEKFGPLTFERERRPLFLDIGIPQSSREYSEETAREIDEEVKKLVDGAYAKVREMLTANQENLRKLAAALLDKETIEGDEIRKLLGLPEKKKE
ncbi:MAG TPA: ATP-dependent zinc metalloprotease FtsH [Nitrospirota bacterium]|nr:ATP-dependent zinc metalloprotease FtsH [Nitrospirota bacterium]